MTLYTWLVFLAAAWAISLSAGRRRPNGAEGPHPPPWAAMSSGPRHGLARGTENAGRAEQKRDDPPFSA